MSTAVRILTVQLVEATDIQVLLIHVDMENILHIIIALMVIHHRIGFIVLTAIHQATHIVVMVIQVHIPYHAVTVIHQATHIVSMDIQVLTLIDVAMVIPIHTQLLVHTERQVSMIHNQKFKILNNYIIKSKIKNSSEYEEFFISNFHLNILQQNLYEKIQKILK